MGLAAYAVNGREPARCVRPSSAGEVTAAVREAHAAREAIVCFGGRTRLEVGNAPTRYDVALDLGALAGVVEHESGDLTARVLAGTTLASLDHALREKGQMWPVEAARPDRATVGGVIAGAAPGPSRLRYAHPRDWVLGVSAVLGDGALTKAGGKVVKNVTGYDLARMYAGSYGSLAVLVEANLKLWPLPDDERTLVARFDDVASAWDALAALRRDRVDVDAAATVDRSAASHVGANSALAVVRVRGARAVVARVVDAVTRALGVGNPEEARPGLLQELTDVPLRASVALRLAVPESRMRDMLAGATGLLRFDGSGIAFLLQDVAGADWVQQWRARAESNGGSAILENAPMPLRSEVDAWGTPVLPHALAARIKAALDPGATLAPGRMPGGL
ncbi:MAG TPA: FAD-binding oxidoreductase [Candidatus Dormibacteraeota bacterium]|nr:FAD-binding oxidoreductase [Candidatus Dormibacteraeota bacterium]